MVSCANGCALSIPASPYRCRAIVYVRDLLSSNDVARFFPIWKKNRLLFLHYFHLYSVACMWPCYAVGLFQISTTLNFYISVKKKRINSKAVQISIMYSKQYTESKRKPKKYKKERDVKIIIRIPIRMIFLYFFAFFCRFSQFSLWIVLPSRSLLQSMVYRRNVRFSVSRT